MARLDTEALALPSTLAVVMHFRGCHPRRGDANTAMKVFRRRTRECVVRRGRAGCLRRCIFVDDSVESDWSGIWVRAYTVEISHRSVRVQDSPYLLGAHRQCLGWLVQW